MIKLFIRDIGIYGLSGIFVRMVTFLLIPFYVRTLTTDNLGVIDFILVISSISGVILSLEIYQFIARFFSEFDESEKNNYASTGLFFYFFTYLGFATIVFIFATPISQYMFNARGYEFILKLAVIAIFINSIFNYFQNLLRYTLKSVHYSISNILFTLSTVCFTIYFVLIQKLGLEGVYFGQIIGGSIGLILSAYYNKKYISISFYPNALRIMLKFSLPLVSSGLALYAITFIDRIFIKQFLSLSELGIYGVAYRISSIPLIFIGFVTSSFVPLMYTKYKNTEIKAELEKIYRFTFFIGFVIITVISIFSLELFAIITTPEYESAYKVAPFLLFSGFLMQFATMFLGLSLTGKTKIIAYIYIIGFVVSVISNIVLIPVFGIMGAGIASSIVAVIIFTLQFYFSQKAYNIHFNYKPYIFSFLISITFSSFVVVFCTQILPIILLFKTISLLLYLLIILFLFKIFALEK